MWRRFDGNPGWQQFTDVPVSDFPVSDAALLPAGAAWWQFKVVGVISNFPMTGFSNTVSFGPVPA